MAATTIPPVIRFEQAALRILLIAMGAGAAFVGASLLTSPLWVPVTIGIWLSAVVMLGLGVFGQLPTE